MIHYHTHMQICEPPKSGFVLWRLTHPRPIGSVATLTRDRIAPRPSRKGPNVLKNWFGGPTNQQRPRGGFCSRIRLLRPSWLPGPSDAPTHRRDQSPAATQRESPRVSAFCSWLRQDIRLPRRTGMALSATATVALGLRPRVQITSGMRQMLGWRRPSKGAPWNKCGSFLPGCGWR